ncbi:DUF6247 family protein [Actinomycetospora flava]|uniref:DUF6247 family protein n=1 Tax=Actinomycetospora flava TaxID=3129232 RepID=A0ABU8M730_9PSEU
MAAIDPADDVSAPALRELGPGATPLAIRAALLPEDRPDFDRAYQEALAEASSSYDLTVVHRVVNQWRGIAALQLDRVQFEKTARRVAELRTGTALPADASLAAVRAAAGI